ncbi:MAG: hypothetical protein CME15_10135 [Gemmatimonadetes bacterium]|nr:hypothetical protein [Gemmatimonadota bacterium]
MTRRALPELAVFLVMAVAIGAMFWEALLLRGAFFVQDVMVQNYPFRHFISTALKEWSFPLWHPGINCGFPLFAEGQSGVLYPFNLITSLLLPTYAALSYNIAFHLWLGSVGMYAFLRQLCCARSPALAGGLTYGLSGYLVVRAMSPNYVDVCAWMPILFLLLELACKRNRWIYVWLAAGVVGLQFLAGHPQAAVYSVGAAVLYGLHRNLTRPGKRAFAAVVLFGVPVLGAGVAAVQLLPTAELVQLSGRSEGVGLAQFVNMSLPPERLITLLLPSFFGNSATGSYWGEEAGFFIQLCPYMGVLPLVLCLIAARERGDGPTTFFTVLIGLSFLLALGRHTVLFESLYGIPGLSFFRIPTRFLLWWAFGGAALAGLGLDFLVKRVDASPGKTYAPLWLLLTAVAAGAIWLNADILTSGPESPALTGEGWRLGQYRSDLISDGLRCALMLGIGIVVVTGRQWSRRRWWRVVVTWLAPAAIAVDLGSFGWNFNSVIDPEVYLRTPDSAAFIQRDATSRAEPGSALDSGGSDASDPLPMTGRFRCASLISERNAPYDWHSGWSLDPTSYRRYPETLRMYTASAYGLANTLPGWSPLHLRRHWEFMGGYPRLLSLANVSYVVSHRPLGFPDLEEVYSGEVRVYHNNSALPRCYVVGDEFSVIEGPRERVRYLLSDRFKPRGEVLLAETPPPLEGARSTLEGATAVSAAAAARISRYRPERVEIALHNIGEAGFLVLSDSHYPGWRAQVDGVATPVLLANHVFRAIRIPAGARTALFEYKPLSFRLGGGISLASLLALVVLAWVGGNRRIWKQEQGPERKDAGRMSPKGWTVQIILIFLLHSMQRNLPYWSEMLDRCRVLSAWGLG